MPEPDEAVYGSVVVAVGIPEPARELLAKTNTKAKHIIVVIIFFKYFSLSIDLLNLKR